MAETQVLAAEPRQKAGKGAARAVRREGRVPAVIYGDKKEPTLISVDRKDVNKLYQTGTFLSQLLNIDVGGTNTRVIPRDVQLDPVRDFVVHVDFLRLGKGAKIAVEVPVHFANEEASPGLEEGGVLNVVRHTVELLCPAESIPEQVEVDLSGLEMGGAVHISDVKLPDGVTPTVTDRDFTIATVAAPSIAPEPEEEAEEVAPDEVEATEQGDGGEEAEGGGEEGSEEGGED